jgi:hypothetical protein
MSFVVRQTTNSKSAKMTPETNSGNVERVVVAIRLSQQNTAIPTGCIIRRSNSMSDGLNYRRIARHLGVDHKSMMNRVKAHSAQLPPAPMP